MTNNDILNCIRQTFDLKESDIIEILSLAETNTTEAQVMSWLATKGDETHAAINDTELATFLNGFINLKRGKREGEQPKAEVHLNNNMVFQKLRIALNLKAEEILEILQLAGTHLSKHELSAFFRKPENKHYRECTDETLRNFLLGVQRQSSVNNTPT